MAKLNKQEINAIANKTLRMINESIEQAREEQIENYVPSAGYQALRKCLERMMAYNLQCEKLNKDLQEEFGIFRNLSPTSEADWFLRTITTDEKINALLKNRIDYEIPMKQAPTLEELKEDITIGAIDEDFDANSFINSLIEKYK